LLHLLRNFRRQIVKYKKHDSLFDEFEEHRLTAEEEENALREVERKREPSPQPVVHYHPPDHPVGNRRRPRTLRRKSLYPSTEDEDDDDDNDDKPAKSEPLTEEMGPSLQVQKDKAQKKEVEKAVAEDDEHLLPSVPNADSDVFLQKLNTFPDAGMSKEVIDAICKIRAHLTSIFASLSSDILGKGVRSFSDVFDPLYESSLNDDAEMLLVKLIFVLKTTLDVCEQQGADEEFVQSIRTEYAQHFASIDEADFNL